MRREDIDELRAAARTITGPPADLCLGDACRRQIEDLPRWDPESTLTEAALVPRPVLPRRRGPRWLGLLVVLGVVLDGEIPHTPEPPHR